MQKFGSDPERKLVVILERDAIKWFKPAKGQFQIFYRQGVDQLETQLTTSRATAAKLMQAVVAELTTSAPLHRT